MTNILNPLKSILFIILAFCCFFAVLAQSRSYTIQVASVETAVEADLLITQLKAGLLEAYQLQVEVPGKGTRYRVRIGSFNSQRAAQQQGEVWRARGIIKNFIVTTYERSSTGNTIGVAGNVTPTPTQLSKQPPF